MTSLRRREVTKLGSPAEEPSSGPPLGRRLSGRAPTSPPAGAQASLGARAPVRLQDAITANEKPTVYGVDPLAAKQALNAYLLTDHGTDKPYCTDVVSGGFAFDPHLGVYVHSTPTCWKPSKAYYENALRAGILGPIPMSKP